MSLSVHPSLERDESLEACIKDLDKPMTAKERLVVAAKEAKFVRQASEETLPEWLTEAVSTMDETAEAAREAAEAAAAAEERAARAEAEVARSRAALEAEHGEAEAALAAKEVLAQAEAAALSAKDELAAKNEVLQQERDAAAEAVLQLERVRAEQAAELLAAAQDSAKAKMTAHWARASVGAVGSAVADLTTRAEVAEAEARAAKAAEAEARAAEAEARASEAEARTAEAQARATAQDSAKKATAAQWSRASLLGARTAALASVEAAKAEVAAREATAAATGRWLKAGADAGRQAAVEEAAEARAALEAAEASLGQLMAASSVSGDAEEPDWLADAAASVQAAAPAADGAEEPAAEVNLFVSATHRRRKPAFEHAPLAEEAAAEEAVEGTVAPSAAGTIDTVSLVGFLDFRGFTEYIVCTTVSAADGRSQEFRSRRRLTEFEALHLEAFTLLAPRLTNDFPVPYHRLPRVFHTSGYKCDRQAKLEAYLRHLVDVAHADVAEREPAVALLVEFLDLPSPLMI